MAETSNTNYKYNIFLTYVKDNVSLDIKSDKLLTITIEYDYDRKNMPIILLRANLDKNLIDHMINNKNKVIILNISKYKETDAIQINKTFIQDEFFYFLDNNVNYAEDIDYGGENADTQDITKVITIGLIKKDSVLKNKMLINGVYSDTSILDMICSRFTHTKLIIEPFENKKIDNIIITPMESLTKFINYIDNEYTLYDTQYRLFHDFNRSYLISSSGKGIPVKDEKYNTVYININNTITKESKVEGMREDKDSKAYIVNIDPSNMNIAVDNTTTLSYNEIIAVDSEGNSKTVSLNSNVAGNRYRITRLNNDNLDKLENVKNNIDFGNTVINIIKEQLDSEVFTINKEFYVNCYDKLKDKSGKYLLVSKKEIYIKEVEDFQMTTIITLKKIPSTY